MHQAGIAQLEQRYPGATVLTAWPMTDELTHPELGYVKQPWDVCRIDDFTPAQIAGPPQEPEKYSAALVFSTKYDPPPPLLSLGPTSEALDERYFGLHHDLPPEAIAHAAGRNAGVEARGPRHVDRADPLQSRGRGADRTGAAREVEVAAAVSRAQNFLRKNSKIR